MTRELHDNGITISRHGSTLAPWPSSRRSAAPARATEGRRARAMARLAVKQTRSPSVEALALTSGLSLFILAIMRSQIATNDITSLCDVMTLDLPPVLLYVSTHEVKMEVDFGDAQLDRLETDRDFDAGFGREVVKGFRKLMQIIRGATDERDFYALKGLHFEKLKGDRAHERSMKINENGVWCWN
jgi:proteic killer suppression protein